VSAKFEVGQQVSIKHRDRAYAGEIVKVGRILVDIRYNGRVVRFLQSTQRALGTRTGPAIYFRIPDDTDRRDRMQGARQALASHGVELSPRHHFTVEQAEALAEVVRTWPQ
jgi:hypothetical protein